MPDASQLTLEILPDNEKRFGPCACCGEMTARVWGYVHRDDAAYAVYYVEWTPGHEASAANFDIIIGEWGEGTSADDREAVALEFRKLETGPAFRVIDAKLRLSLIGGSLASRLMDRDDVIGTPMAAEAFAICDLIYLDDPRIGELKE